MTTAGDERLGPAFDTNILSRPTQRKFVGCWMDRAGLRAVLVGANMPRTSGRLLNRWECSRDLHRVVERALTMSAHSKSLRYERMRTEWHREYGRLPPNVR